MLLYMGLQAGNWWDYRLIPSGNHERDSVEWVFPLPTLGKCSDLSGQIVRIGIFRDTVYDSTFMWVGNGYYHTLFHRFAKYNAVLGDTWEAWNTCLIPLDTPLAVVDMDMDSITDTLVYRSSTARVESTDEVVAGLGGNVKVVLSLNQKIVFTSLLSPDSTLITEYRSYYYKPHFGITRVMLDSIRTVAYYGSFSLDNTLTVGSGKEIVPVAVDEGRVVRKDVRNQPLYDKAGRRTRRRGLLRKGRVVIY